MTLESEPRAARWRRGVRSTDWTDDDRVYATLLDALTRDLADAETTQLELDARARRSMADLHESQEQLERELRDTAHKELGEFRAALRDAHARSGQGGRSEVPYDSADPEQDARAGLLIEYLVRPDYAEVRTEEPVPGHYIYYLRIDWPRLRVLAEEEGRPFVV